MTIQVKAFQTPKNGSTSQECQDAVAWNEQTRNFAIADGVSDSAFQSLWADLLVNSFVAQAGSTPEFSKAWLTTWLQNEQSQWNSQVNWDTVPWHGRLKAEQTGAQATFLGIRLLPESHSWVGIAIGDCNLFHFSKDGTFKESIPNKRAADFSNATQAFSSISQDQEHVQKTKRIQGTYEPGETLVLATDAMARWMLERLEENQNPLDEIPTSNAPGVFDQWVNTLRQAGKMKDDDTSVLVIQPDPVPVPVRTDGKQRGQTKRPQPAPPRTETATPFWISVYLISALLFTTVGFWLGSAWQNSQSGNHLEENVQKPLLDFVKVLTLTPRISKGEVEKGLLVFIINTQPETQTSQAARNLFCQLFPAEPSCESTSTPTPVRSPRSFP
jgi:hypothetical protein